MKSLFIGACVAHHDYEYILRNERYAVQHAAQKVCWYFIDGLDAASEEPWDVLCTLRVSTYPGFSKILAFNLPLWERGPGIMGRYIPYLTLPGLQYISTIFSTIIKLMGWAWRTRRINERVIVCYAMYTPIILPTLIFSKIFGVSCFMIVPDLPEFTGPAEEKYIPALFRKINASIAHHVAKHYDGLILFSKNMNGRLELNNREWLVIEGVVGMPPATYDKPIENKSHRNIMYSGVLDSAYGVKNLLDAFHNLNYEDAELWLCGEGSLQEEIKQLAVSDKRIKYFGRLPNNEVVALQRRSTVLINPRGGQQMFTRYSFPSKNLEYMCSGRPVILCRMDGIPDEYYDYVFSIEENSSNEILRILIEVLNMNKTELDAVGEKARDFVYTQKNYRFQGLRVRQFIEDVIDEKRTTKRKHANILSH